jgi:diguanylate cyclase (GGDEF)-like protein
MSPGEMVLEKQLLENCINWFQSQFRESVVSRIESQFPNCALPHEIQNVLRHTADFLRIIRDHQESIEMASLVQILSSADPGRPLSADPARPLLFKQIVLRYRRWRTAQTEGYTEKTFHLELTGTLEEDVKALDVLAEQDFFQQIEPMRLARPKDFLPIQFIEQSATNQLRSPARQYDEKFHILQAPNLFLQDLAYFRGQCEDREVPMAIAFLDIDHFKGLNDRHSETTVDRNLLPRFMQEIEAHVFHHGYAYRQGGDEYLILLPSMSRKFTLLFLDELRCKLARLEYQGIEDRTTVSIGVCIAEPDCPLTDRELRDRANLAKKEAKSKGRNRIAYYDGPRFIQEELRVFDPDKPPPAPNEATPTR